MAINKRQNSKGVSLLGLLIVVAIITTGLVYLLGIFSFSIRIAGSEKQLSQANFIAQEAMEGVRNFRDGTNWQEDGLGTLITSISYHLEKTGIPLEWILFPEEKTTNGFKQIIIFDDARRNLNDDIVENGGEIDSNTKKVTVSVSWTERGKPYQIELITFLTNWQE